MHAGDFIVSVQIKLNIGTKSMNYKEILQAIVDRGIPKQPVRGTEKVENGTIGLFCENFRHDMSQGFPLTTLRQVPWKSLRIELEGFIKGVTSKEWYQSQGCNFWNEWANPIEAAKLIGKELPNDIIFDGDKFYCKDLSGNKTQADYTVFDKKDAQFFTDDLGPIYGYQWRHFDQHYGEYKSWPVGEPNAGGEYQWDDNTNGITVGTDQLKSVVDQLKKGPYDRRMVVSAWNPNQMYMMALPSCHVLWNVVVYGNKLNLVWFQRSCDASHGVPANIASYGLLLLLLCEESGLVPGELVGVLSDCHLYENTIPSVRILLEREEKELPTVKIKRKPDGSFSIFDWKYDEVELIGYNPHPKVNMGAVTV